MSEVTQKNPKPGASLKNALDACQKKALKLEAEAHFATLTATGSALSSVQGKAAFFNLFNNIITHYAHNKSYPTLKSRNDTPVKKVCHVFAKAHRVDEAIFETVKQEILEIVKHDYQTALDNHPGTDRAAFQRGWEEAQTLLQDISLKTLKATYKENTSQASVSNHKAPSIGRPVLEPYADI